MTLKCWLGFHQWRRIGVCLKQCKHCERVMRLEFYSNRTSEWVVVK